MICHRICFVHSWRTTINIIQNRCSSLWPVLQLFELVSVRLVTDLSGKIMGLAVAVPGKVAGCPAVRYFVHEMIACDVVTGVEAIEIQLHMAEFFVAIALQGFALFV